MKKKIDDKIEITLESDDKNMSFDLTLLNVDNQSMNIPRQNFDVEMCLPSTDFTNSLKTLNAFCENVVLDIKKERKNQMDLLIKSDQGNGKIQVKNIENMKINESFNGLFSLKHLVMFTKAKDLCDNIILLLKKDAPLLMEYHIGNDDDKNEQLVVLSFYLAPKIQED